jgi:hypothetical protein
MVSNAIELADIELRRQQGAPDALCGGPAAQPAAGRPDPDRTGADQPAQERGRSHRAGRPPPGQRQVELRVAPRQEDQDVVEFSVRDSGNGVPTK